MPKINLINKRTIIKIFIFFQIKNFLGLNFPQPIEMTRLEWEKELQQFQEALTPELRALLPEVQNRLKPLAKVDFSQPIAEQLNSRFQKSENEKDIKPVNLLKIFFKNFF